MNKFKILALLCVILFMFGCKKAVNTGPVEIKYDREVCKRCVMQVCDRFNSAQIVDPVSGDHFFFDDLGCGVLWLDENDLPWIKDAILYFTDAKTGKWLNAKKAVLVAGFKTPMSFGIAAFSSKNDVPEGKEIITYEEAQKIFRDIKKERMNKKAQQAAEEEAKKQAEEQDKEQAK